MSQPNHPIQLAQQINQIILHGSDAETVLQTTAQAVGEAFGADGCLIAVTEMNSATSCNNSYWQLDSSLPLLPQQILALRQLATAAKTVTKPLVINDIHVVEPEMLASLPNLPTTVQAILSLPTQFQGKENGLISLIYTQPHQWSNLEIVGISDIAVAVAIAISHVSQSAMIATLQQQVQTSAKYKSLINQLTMASRGSLELEQILQLTLAGVARVLQVDRGLILTLKYTGPLSRYRERRGKIPQARVKVANTWLNDSNPEILGRQNYSDYSFWLSECLLCQQALTNSPQALAIADKTSLAKIAPVTEIEPVFVFATFPSLVMFPIESQGTVLGFLVLQQSGDRLWHDEELALVELIAAMVSTAIIQSQTLRQVQSLVDERTSQLQRSLEVQGKLYEKTRQQIDQLRHLNQLKDEFVSTMNHELRTPLTSMSLAIRMLRQPGLSVERQARYLNILEQQCNQEIQLIHDLLKLQEIESNKTQLKLETINLKSKLAELAQAFTEKWAEKGLTITVDVSSAVQQVQTDVDSIERILQELLTNAGKYSDSDTNVALRATHQLEQQSSQLVLSLTNTGAGIAPEDLNYIFDKFHRGQGVTQQAIQGTGLGLALVKCLVQQLNGTIDVSSIAIQDGNSHETCFTLSLPQSFLLRSTPTQP